MMALMIYLLKDGFSIIMASAFCCLMLANFFLIIETFCVNSTFDRDAHSFASLLGCRKKKHFSVCFLSFARVGRHSIPI
jgi:hypothetical protein